MHLKKIPSLKSLTVSLLCILPSATTTWPKMELTTGSNHLWIPMWIFVNMRQTSKFYYYSANHESYQMDCFATFAKSALWIRLFWRNCKRWLNKAPKNSNYLQSCPEMIVHVCDVMRHFVVKCWSTYSGNVSFHWKVGFLTPIRAKL
jgi:hypothetical protein